MGNSTARKVTLTTGAVLSVALGVFFYIRTDTPTALATFASLLGVTITLQIETIFRERQEAEDATRQQRLVRQVESLPWLADWVDRAADALAEIDRSYGGTMAADLARTAFRDCQIQLADLRRGRYVTWEEDDSPRNPVRPLTERLTTSLLATSAGADIDWWTGDSSNRSVYWQLNEQALVRGVEIKRIFIYQQWTRALEDLVIRHHAAGIRVLTVDQRLLPLGLRINITVWDERCGFELRSNAAGEVIAQHFTFARDELALMIDRFRLIESSAQPWTGVVP